jgi:hypothetical protein
LGTEESEAGRRGEGWAIQYMSDIEFWLLHILPWLPVTLLAIAVLLRQSKQRRLLLEIKLQLNGDNSNKKDVPAAQLASGEGSGGSDPDPRHPDHPL